MSDFLKNLAQNQLPESVFVPHDYADHRVDLGEVRMNYATTGSPHAPALLLIPGQTESWWGFEAAMKILETDFQVFAVDLRGQGRSTRTPGRYSLDNIGNDLIRFITTVIKRPVIASGCSSGGVLSAWLSAYALPGQIRASHYEDPPLFASELNPAFGHNIRHAAGPIFELFRDHLGDQWEIGDWDGLRLASPKHMPPGLRFFPETPPQNLMEYDPEWGRAFFEGKVAMNCPHDRMLGQVKVPVLITHHSRVIIPANGYLFGAMSDFQAEKAVELIKAAGQEVRYVSLPDAAHAMHAADPERFAEVLTDWVRSLPA